MCLVHGPTLLTEDQGSDGAGDQVRPMVGEPGGGEEVEARRGDDQDGKGAAARGAPTACTEDQGIGGVGGRVRPMVGEAGGGEEGARGGDERAGTERGSVREKREKTKDVPRYLYVGETCRSAYERGLEHYNDIKGLNPSSHMLKHLIDKHEYENFEEVDFRMEVLSFSRTAYERQIMEAVEIQHHRESHFLLNSRAEFNRSAIPRLGLKLGEKEYKDMRKEEQA